jgi:hypothetical protein
VPAQGAKTARHGTSGQHLAFFNMWHASRAAACSSSSSS